MQQDNMPYEKLSDVRKAFLKVLLQKELRKNTYDPATRRPIIAGLRSIASLNFIAVGPYRETAANPKKNPKVLPINPIAGVPLVLN